MEKNLTLTRSAIKWLSAIAVICGLGWWYFDYRFPSWNEEVMLSDGRMLIVHRRHDYIEGYGVRRTWLTFSLPEMRGQQTWSEWMYPAIVDVSDGKVFVVGYTPGVRQFRSYLDPRYLLVAYTWNGTDFMRIPFLSVPEKIRQQWNVLPCSTYGENTNWQQKTRGWCGEQGEYVAGASRQVNLTKLEAGAKNRASLDKSTNFSE